MSEADSKQAEVQPDTNQPEAIQAELDRHSDVQGDLVPNPAIIEEEIEGDDDAAQEDDSQSAEPAAMDDKGDDGSADGDDNADHVAAEHQPAAADASQPAAELKAETPKPAADPGDFAPATDYSFEIATTDGKTVTISSPAEADAFAARLDDNPELISASQYTKFNRHSAKMDVGLANEQAAWQARKADFEAQAEANQAREDQVRQWDNEVKYLRAKGLLPEITPQLAASNWNDPANAEQPAVKETLAVFKWMETENGARRAAGIAEVTSAVDALTMMRAEQAETAAGEAKTKEGDGRRKRGAMVGGNAPQLPSNQPKNSIIGVGGSLNDLVMEASNAL